MKQKKNQIIEIITETFTGKTILYFIKWMIVSAVVGALGGIIGGIFGTGVKMATSYRGEYPWLLYLMPLAGLLIVGLYQVTGEGENRGTNMILATISSSDAVTPATGPLIFVSTIVTHLVGGSAGREGAALQLGGWLGDQIGKLPIAHMDERERKMVVICGMTSVFAALFGTPVAATVFCMEVASVGIIYYASLLPCMLAAFVGRDVAGLFGMEPERFAMPQVADLEVTSIYPVIFLGVLIAILSIVFIKVLHETEHLLKKFFPNPYVRVLAASAVFIVLTLLVGTRIYCGSSMILIEESLEGHVIWPAFILKMVFTAIALGGGFKGGEIIPTLCVGSTFGCVIGTLFGVNPSLMAALGMIGLFAAVTNCPLASIFIGVEMFGGAGLSYFAVVVALSYSLSGYHSLYKSQKFIYGKLKNIFINRMSN